MGTAWIMSSLDWSIVRVVDDSHHGRWRWLNYTAIPHWIWDGSLQSQSRANNNIWTTFPISVTNVCFKSWDEQIVITTATLMPIQHFSWSMERHGCIFAPCIWFQASIKHNINSKGHFWQVMETTLWLKTNQRMLMIEIPAQSLPQVIIIHSPFNQSMSINRHIVTFIWGEYDKHSFLWIKIHLALPFDTHSNPSNTFLVQEMKHRDFFIPYSNTFGRNTCSPVWPMERREGKRVSVWCYCW
jgi:hypothetical protein